ncbi:hypothetical protein PFISCL1PPCAC_14489, partial [Pristionchus fissidentatus]
MPTYKFNYFDSRGLVQISRQMFILSGTPFEDNRIPKEQWPELKKTMPFGTMPVLEVDGKQIPQSLAIARYLAKEFGETIRFNTPNPIDNHKILTLHTICKEKIEVEAWVDAIADQAMDLFAEIRPYFMVAMGAVPGDKEQMKKDVALPALEKHFGYLEKVASKNGSNGHLVGSSLTFVDLMVSEFVTTFSQFFPSLTDSYPAVAAVKTKTINTPKLKEWIEKRP